MSALSSKDLCLQLIHSETEEQVIQLLRSAGYWDNEDCWRYYGDNPNNWAAAGGQQARSDFALNEKVVNAIDSVLVRHCLDAGIDPESPAAPQSIRAAVARFVEGSKDLKSTAGRVEDWTRDFSKKVAEDISIFSTEPAGAARGMKPSISIADLGEGQTPNNFPRTFLSLHRSNKTSVPFVQGKFGQGGTGVFRHGGPNRLQLIVSRRRQSLVGAPATGEYPTDSRDGEWGFTVIRREKGGKFPTLTYLAPGGSDVSPRCGDVLSFPSDSLQIFPQGDVAYERAVEFGTLIKLYEYQLKNVGNILRRNGLLQKLDLLLPDPALPVRMHECRPDKRAGGNEQTTTMRGLFSRLKDNSNVELAPPAAIPLNVNGRQLMARIYAFKPDRSETYREAEGVIFTVNGQAHAWMKANIFARKAVGLHRLAKDLLVVVDCSAFDSVEINDLFMSSRDRLADDSPLAQEVERQIEVALHDHAGLRELKNRRAQEDVSEQLSNDKPLESVLKQVLQNSPTLAKLFGLGEKLSNPFKPESVKPGKVPPKLVQHPTYFRHEGHAEGETPSRTAPLGQRRRLKFITDAQDDFFVRKYDAGKFRFYRVTPTGAELVPAFVGPNLVAGRCNVTFELPVHAEVGDRLVYRVVVEDEVTGRVFDNSIELVVADAQQPNPHRGGRPKPPGPPDGPLPDGPSGIAFPKVHWLKSGALNWSQHFNHPADCLEIVNDSDTDDDGKTKQQFSFYINEDNVALQHELKVAKTKAEIVRKQFEVAVVLIGLALANDHFNVKKKPETADKDEDAQFYETVKTVTRAMAPVLLPMIQSLGSLGDDGSDQSDQVGLAA